jgi:hypothetical protein
MLNVLNYEIGRLFATREDLPPGNPIRDRRRVKVRVADYKSTWYFQMPKDSAWHSPSHAAFLHN